MRVCAALVAVLPGRVHATETSSSLSPDAAVALALSRSDAVKRARLDVEIARVEGTTLVLDSPEVQIGHRSLNALGSQVDPFDDSQIGLAWRPPALAKLGINQALGARAAAADQRDVDELAADVAVEVRTLHAQILALRAERALDAERAALLDRMLALQERRVAEQVGTALDVELTSLDLLDARAEVADLDGDLARNEQRLAGLLGEAMLPPLSPPSTPLCALPPAGLDALLERARSRSPRLKAINVREEALGLRETRAWLRFVPWIDNLQLGVLGQQDGTTEVRARVDVAVPLFAPLAPDLRLVSLEREALAAERRAVQRDLDEKVRAAWDRVVGFEKIVAVYVSSADRLRGSEDVVGRALAAELVDTLRVVSVQQRVLNARRQEVRTRARCDEAAIALAAAVGDVFDAAR
jgi:outer membrane protein TolC